MLTLNQIKAVLFGHAVGDALGVPVEFRSRKELSENPVTDMRGYGTYRYPKGTWSDDTSMCLCALDSLSKGQVDFDEIMENFFLWKSKGEFTPTGVLFDIGITCSLAIDNYSLVKLPPAECGLNDERSNGNGSLMRIYPFVLYLYAENGELTEEGLELIFTASALTHAHRRSQLACGIYAFVLMELLENPSVNSIKQGLEKAKNHFCNEVQLSYFSRIFEPGFASTPIDKINSGGYVVDTLEASIWCLLNTSNYSDCVLKAVNLGEDTDTTAAVAGSLAGALYGCENIPREWVQTLLRRDYLETLCKAVQSNF